MPRPNPPQKPPPQQLPPLAGYQVLDVCCPHCRMFAPQYLRAGLDASNLVCYWCGQPFYSRLVEIRAKRSQGDRKTNSRSFQVRVFDADKSEHLIQFSSQSYEDFELRAKDKTLFSYIQNSVIVVQNITVSRLYFTRSLNKNCYIATCVYGEESREVATLRAFRDEKLLPHPFGVALVGLYYLVSPHAVQRFGNKDLFRMGAHIALRPVVASVSRWARRRRRKMFESN